MQNFTMGHPMLKMLTSAFALAVACSTGHAQAPTPTQGWMSVGFNEYGIYEAQKGSFDVTQNKNNEQIAVVTGKLLENSTKRLDLQKWYVRTAHCAAKQGKVVTLGLDGEFKYDSDFIIGTGTIASAKAEFICDVYEYFSTEKRKKSL